MNEIDSNIILGEQAEEDEEETKRIEEEKRRQEEEKKRISNQDVSLAINY